MGSNPTLFILFAYNDLFPRYCRVFFWTNSASRTGIVVYRTYHIGFTRNRDGNGDTLVIPAPTQRRSQVRLLLRSFFSSPVTSTQASLWLLRAVTFCGGAWSIEESLLKVFLRALRVFIAGALAHFACQSDRGLQSRLPPLPVPSSGQSPRVDSKQIRSARRSTKRISDGP